MAERDEQLQSTLLGWYAEVGRDLPWRRTRDPYAVLVSEIMAGTAPLEGGRPSFDNGYLAEAAEALHMEADAAFRRTIEPGP